MFIATCSNTIDSCNEGTMIVENLTGLAAIDVREEISDLFYNYQNKKVRYGGETDILLAAKNMNVCDWTRHFVKKSKNVLIKNIRTLEEYKLVRDIGGKILFFHEKWDEIKLKNFEADLVLNILTDECVNIIENFLKTEKYIQSSAYGGSGIFIPRSHPIPIPCSRKHTTFDFIGTIDSNEDHLTTAIRQKMYFRR